jgi:uncharacterized protein involved in tolerance to divalent cations
MNDERAVFVYTTHPSLVEAERTAKAVLEKRLAACVNILPGMISHYWWQGVIERGEEVVMIIKTRASLAEAVRAGRRPASKDGTKRKRRPLRGPLRGLLRVTALIDRR